MQHRIRTNLYLPRVGRIAMRTANPHPRYGFHGDDFYVAVARVLRKRNASWRQLANEIGVSPSTFTRWGRGRSLDARVLAALSAWAGLNPADYVGDLHGNGAQQPLSEILAMVRDDPNQSADTAAALQRLIRAAYEQLTPAAPSPARPTSPAHPRGGTARS